MQQQWIQVQKNNTNVELIKLIKDLWPHVYQKDVTINNEISLAFAKDILAKRKGWDVSWAQFATKVQCTSSQTHKGCNLSSKSSFKQTQVYMYRKAKLTSTKEIIAQKTKDMFEATTFGRNLILRWKRRTLKMEEMI